MGRKMAHWAQKGLVTLPAPCKSLSALRFWLVVGLGISSTATRSINGSTDELDDTTMPPLHPLSRQVSQVRLFCSDPECQLTWTPVPNMVAALTGYNPIIGNSLSGDRPDPGTKQQNFVPTFQKSDGRLDLHDNIHFFDDVHCQVDTETKIVKSFRDYQSLKGGSWQLSRKSTQSSSFNVPLIFLITNFGKKSSSSHSFGNASQFATEASFFREHQGEIFYNQAKCTVYRIDVNSFAKPEFHPSFKEALRQLNKAAKEPTSRRNEEEHSERQNCIKRSFEAAMGVVANVTEISVSASVPEDLGSLGTSSGGWGANSDITFNREAKNCLNDTNGNRFYLEKGFERTRITSVGSTPKLDPQAWADDVKNSPAVIHRKLNEISSLFTEEFIGDIPEEEPNPSTGRLDPASMKELFNNGLADYCQLMLGEECPSVKGCGFNDLCGPDESCRDNNSTVGFICIPDTIVLSSKAGAAEYVGGALGEFVRIGDHNNRPHYKQRDTEGVTDHYLYYISGGWRVSPTLGGSLSWLKNRQDTDLPPRANWRYYNGKKWLDDDGTLKLDYTTLSPCKLVRVASSGFWFLLHSSRLDDYRLQEGRWSEGRPVYKKGSGSTELFLRVPEGKSAWAITPSTTSSSAWLQSGRATNSPTSPHAGASGRFGVSRWRYYDGDSWKEGDISFFCN